MDVFAGVLSTFITILTYVVIADVLLSYFMDPYHPIRRALDQVVNPMLQPIRRLMPNTGGIDFSPIILILILQLVGRLLVGLLVR